MTRLFLSSTSALGFAIATVGVPAVVHAAPLLYPIPSPIPSPVSSNTLTGTSKPGNPSVGKPVVSFINPADPNAGQQTVVNTTRDNTTTYTDGGNFYTTAYGQDINGSYSAGATVTGNQTSTLTSTSVPNTSYDPNRPTGVDNQPYTVTSGTPTAYAPTLGTTPTVSNVSLNANASTDITGMVSAVVTSTTQTGTTAHLTGSAGEVTTDGTLYVNATGTATFDPTTGKTTTSLDSANVSSLTADGLQVRSIQSNGSTLVTVTASGLNNGGNTITNVGDGVNASDAATKGQVDAETTRATGAEGVLQANINTETGLRVAGDAATLSSAKGYTDTSVSTEAGLRVAGDAATLASANTYTDTSVAAETVRATAQETALGQRVTAEASRAIAAETTLGNRINAETARAQGAEQQLDGKINASTAMAAALSGSTFLPNTKYNLSANVATYAGASAASIQGAFLVSPHVAVNAGVAFNFGGKNASGGSAVARAGVTFGW